MKLYDVVIVGGGMVGATLACCLAGQGLSIAVVESVEPQPFSSDSPHDMRVSALNLSSRTILSMIGVWPLIEKMRLCPFDRMQVFESRGVLEFCSHDIGEQDLGYIVENRVVQLALLEQLRQLENIELYCPVETARIDYAPAGSSVTLADGRQLGARLLVAADGGHSRVRKAVSIGVSGHDYRQHALVVSVKTAYPQQSVTWQQFLPSGPQAFLPLSGPHASLVWYNDADEVRRLSRLPDDQFMQELTASYHDKLGVVEAILGRSSFPLRSQQALDYVKGGVALVGDAAHTINPLAGQGVNIGLLDAAALAEVVLEANSKGEDFASIHVLDKYQRMRRKDNQLMMSVMEFFYRTYSNDFAPLRHLRDIGLGVANRLGPAKNWVMRQAMGIDGYRPRLAKGQPIP